MLRVVATLLFAAAACQAAVHSRYRRDLPKQTGADELNFKTESGYDAYYKEAKAAAKGDWMSKEIVLAKYWKLWGPKAVEKVQKASEWYATRKDIDATAYANIQKEMDLDTSQVDKDGRTLLYQQVGKPKFIEHAKDPATVANWLGGFIQIWIEAIQGQMKKYEEKKSDYTQITLLYNYEGFAKEVYLCPVCVNFGKDKCEAADNYLPLGVYRAFLVNTPPEFELFWNLVSILLAKDTRDRISVFGAGKDKWAPEVSKFIDAAVIDKLIK